MLADVTSALVELAQAFAALGVRWYVFGAQAVVAAGVPRLSHDLDVTVEAPAGGAPALVETLEAHGFALRDVGADVATFIAETRVIPMMVAQSKFPIDVVLAGPGLEEDMLARVTRRTVSGVPIPFVDTADLIALKLLAGREKDLEDVRALVRARSNDLDLDLARQRVAELGSLLDDSTLSETLDRAIKEARAKKRRR